MPTELVDDVRISDLLCGQQNKNRLQLGTDVYVKRLRCRWESGTGFSSRSAVLNILTHTAYSLQTDHMCLKVRHLVIVDIAYQLIHCRIMYIFCKACIFLTES